MTLTSAPQLISAGLVLLDATTGAMQRTIALQYNPNSLSRTFQVQGIGGEGGGERAQPFRLKGPAIESMSQRPNTKRLAAVTHALPGPTILSTRGTAAVPNATEHRYGHDRH